MIIIDKINDVSYEETMYLAKCMQLVMQMEVRICLINHGDSFIFSKDSIIFNQGLGISQDTKIFICSRYSLKSFGVQENPHLILGCLNANQDISSTPATMPAISKINHGYLVSSPKKINCLVKSFHHAAIDFAYRFKNL